MKIKDLDADAISEDINSKFKVLHIMAIEYSQAVTLYSHVLHQQLERVPN